MLRFTRAAVWSGAAAFVLAAAPAVAAEPNPKQAYLTSAEGGADFRDQGEYVGEVAGDAESVRYGAQVVARGDGKFDIVGLPGGLPGDGWLGGQLPASGERTGDEVVFENAEGTAKARLGDGKIRVEVDGREVAVLDKTERESPTLGAKPPEGAVVLFSGKESELENFEGARFEDGHLREGFKTKRTFGDHTLHLEFRLSFMPYATGQQRSNSGCYVQGRYEVQILDSFGLEGKDNECGGVYKAKAPEVNMCLPPLAWQTYDIDFTAAKFDASGAKTAPARMTVKHNGVVIHDDLEVPTGTPGGTQAEGPGPGPLFIQNHGDPVWFRNIWVVEK